MVRRRVDVAISWLNGTSMSHAPLAVIACSPTARVLSVYPDDIPEDERIYPHSNWSTASAAQISKKGYPADFRVKAAQMRDWEAMSRASLGILNHLDWFMSSVWTVLDGCAVEKDRQADIDKLMSASGIAVNQLAHIQMRSLASNATVRREAILESSVLDRQGALFLRSQPIGGTDLFGGRCAEALRVASEQKKNSLLFQATMGASRKSGSGPSAGPSRIPPRSRRNKRKGGYSSSQPAAKQAFHSRRVEQKGQKLGVTASWTTKPKV